MLNVVVPMSGPMPYFQSQDYPYPKPLVEVRGRTMVEYVVENIELLGRDVRPIFLLREDLISRFHLDNTLSLLTDGRAVALPVAESTRGALCTCLLAAQWLANDDPVLVLNFDQYFEAGFAERVAQVFDPRYDGGCLTFDSVHPRWSFVRDDASGVIVEAAEKRPISRNAVAGAYGFQRGGDFIEAAQRAILNETAHEGMFYLSAALNELVLMGRSLRAVPVAAGSYRSFYSPQKIGDESFGGHPLQ